MLSLCIEMDSARSDLAWSLLTCGKRDVALW